MLPPPSDDNRYAELLRRVENLETALRAAFTTIGGGAGLQIIDGGKLALVAANGTVIFYIGPVLPNQADGSPQPGWVVRRADGSVVLDLRDAVTTDDGGVLKQALNWRDRAGNVVLADDTDGGQGHARPWLSGGFTRSRFADMSVTTTSSTFETLWEARLSRQQPRLMVRYRATMDTTGTTGETQVLVNDAPFGAVGSEGFVITTRNVGPIVFPGTYSGDVFLKIQGRRTSATGGLRVEAAEWETRQT